MRIDKSNKKLSCRIIVTRSTVTYQSWMVLDAGAIVRRRGEPDLYVDQRLIIGEGGGRRSLAPEAMI